MSEPAEPVSGPDGLPDLEPLLDRLEELLAQAEAFEAPVRDTVFELLDGIDALHRLAVHHLADQLGDLGRLALDPAVSWLFTAYGIGVDDPAQAERALEPIRPYLHQHGGEVSVLSVQRGVVRVRLTGACAGCTAAAVTLRDGVQEALRDGLPGFVTMTVEPDQAAAHPPPTGVLVQITARPDLSQTA